MATTKGKLIRLDMGEEAFVTWFLRQSNRSLKDFRCGYHWKFNYYPGPEVVALLKVEEGTVTGYAPLSPSKYVERVEELCGERK